MDVVFHALTGAAISKAATGDYLLGASVFAMLPDLLGAVPYTYIKIKKSSKESVVDFIKDFQSLSDKNIFFGRYDKVFYKGTHSWLFIIPVAVVGTLFGSVWWVLVLCYFSHLIIDLPTHEGEFAQTPFYPLSEWSIQGKSWWMNKITYGLYWAIIVAVLLLQQIWGYFGKIG